MRRPHYDAPVEMLPDRLEVDVAVMGGGIVGLFNAIHLAKRGVRVAIIDTFKRLDSFKVGESLFGYTTVLLSYACDGKEYMRAQPKKNGPLLVGGMEGRDDFSSASELTLFAKERLFGPGKNRLDDERTDAAFVDRTIARPESDAFLLERARRDPRITVIDPALVTEIQIGTPHRLTWTEMKVPGNGASAVEGESLARGKTGEVTCRWLLDCSGRNRVLVRKLGLDQPWDDDFQTSAVWGHFEGLQLPLEQFKHQSRADWLYEGRLRDRRRYTLHLWGDRNWIWVIHLRGGRTSIGATYTHDGVPPGKTYEDKFWSIIDRYPTLKAMHDATKLQFQVYKNVQYRSKLHVSPERFALLGDSGTAIDAYYSQGMATSLTCSWHVANLIERDLGGQGIDQSYLDRINEAIACDYEIHRAMVRWKFYHSWRDPRFFMQSIASDFGHLVFADKVPLTALLSETDGTGIPRTLKHRLLRNYLERHLFMSRAFPYGWLLPPRGVMKLQQHLQNSAAKQAEKRRARGIVSRGWKFLINEPPADKLPFPLLAFGGIFPMFYWPLLGALYAEDHLEGWLATKGGHTTDPNF